jgi:hypothetical protein
MKASFVAIALALTACVSDQTPTVQAEIAPPPPKLGPSPFDALKAKATGPWRHVPEPVSNQQLERDKARCRVQMDMVPLNPLNSPAVIEIRLYSFFINCMEAEGYVAPPASHSRS